MQCRYKSFGAIDGGYVTTVVKLITSAIEEAWPGRHQCSGEGDKNVMATTAAAALADDIGAVTAVTVVQARVLTKE